MRKGDYTKNTVIEKGCILPKPVSSQDENNKNQEVKFPGRLSQSRISPYENHGKPWELKKTLGRSISPRNKHLHTSGKTLKTGGTNRHLWRYWTEQRRQLAQKRLRKITDHFWASSNNVRDIKRENNPQDRSRSLEQLSRSVTAEKPKKNIQGVKIYIVKINNNG